VNTITEARDAELAQLMVYAKNQRARAERAVMDAKAEFARAQAALDHADRNYDQTLALVLRCKK
jgi:hypothetical protein